MLAVLITILATANLHAIENLPCQRALAASEITLPGGERIALRPDQIVVRGKLSAHWETGMEDQTGWSLLDQHTFEHLSGNGYDALHFFAARDRVFILNDAGTEIVAAGVHDERQVPTKRNILGRDVELFPNVPRLLTRPDADERVVDDEVYAEQFELEAPAIAILTLPPDRLARLNQELAPKLAAARAHLADPARFVDVGSGRTHEMQVFEKVLAGRPETRADGRVRIVAGDGPQRLLPRDVVYLMDDDGRALGAVRIENFPASVAVVDLGRFVRAKRAVVIRVAPEGSWVETDF